MDIHLKALYIASMYLFRLFFSWFGFFLLFPCISQATDFRYAVADVVHSVIPSVVTLQVTSPSHYSVEVSQGSGVIVHADGYILTNCHVIQNASEILVTLSDKRKMIAHVVGLDPQTDLAVLQLEKKVSNLPVVKMGDVNRLRVGEVVVVVGNPYGLTQTVTTGVVSAKGVYGRNITHYENFIQTDAAINPGNSGGGMFNLSGELVGINTAILTKTGGFQGIGFAIPIDIAQNVMKDLITYGSVNRGYLGISVQDLTPALSKAFRLPDYQGALISMVISPSPAAKAGLREGDVITSINEKPISNANDLRNTIAALRSSDSVTLEFRRAGLNRKNTVTILMTALPSKPVPVPQKKKTNENQLGMEITPIPGDIRQKAGLSSKEGGVYVVSVWLSSLGAKAGIVPGDILLRLNGEPIKSIPSLKQQLSRIQKQESLVFLVRRDASQFFTVIEMD